MAIWTIQEIEEYLAQKARSYDFDEDFKAAERELIVRKNPIPNYLVGQRAALRPYLEARRAGSSKEYLAWTRRSGLNDLRDLRIRFALFGIFNPKKGA